VGLEEVANMKTHRIAMLGAECTGKSALTQALAAEGIATVPEYLREWCLREGRTPLRHEQEGIAREQQRRIEAVRAPLVVADTTALMTALYSVHYFNDASLMPWALAEQRRIDLTLLCCPEGIPWQADGFLRDGADTRARTHAELLALLASERIAFTLLQGSLPQRLSRVGALLNMPAHAFLDAGHVLPPRPPPAAR
jgi:nicotinamide riboside kinase